MSSYTYDRLHRMTAEVITGDPHGMNGSATYGLDAVGNRTDRFSTIDLLVEQRDLTYNTRDWLDFDSYDFNGNTVRSVTGVPAVEVTDSYDFRNRLIRRTTASGTIIDLYYDADGIRIGKRLDDGAGNIKTEWWLVDSLNPTGYAQVLEEFSGDPAASSAEAAYLAGLDLARVNSIGLDLIGYDARDETGTWHLRYFGYDGHGSVRELLDANGDVVESYTYDAFGILLDISTFIPQPSTLQNSYLYTGERWDKDLGLYYLRARYMNPQTGRFHTMDTYEGSMTDPVTLHKYLYANGNPVMFADPSGKVGLGQAVLTGAIVGVVARLAVISYDAFLGSKRQRTPLGIALDLVGAAGYGAAGGLIAAQIAPIIAASALTSGVFGTGAITAMLTGSAIQQFKEFVDFFILRKDSTLKSRSGRIYEASVVSLATGGFVAKLKPILPKSNLPTNVKTIQPKPGTNEFMVVGSWKLSPDYWNNVSQATSGSTVTVSVVGKLLREGLKDGDDD